MYKVSEIAKILGVSPQAIYKRINHDSTPGLKRHIHKSDSGAIMIDNKGLELLRNDINPVDNQTTKVDEPVNNQVESNDYKDDYIEALNEHIATLQEQLTIKDEQINQLNDRLKEVNKLNSNNQVLIAQKMGLVERIKQIFNR